MDAIHLDTGTTILLLAAFVLPGFITLVFRESTYVIREATTPFERLLLSLSYSVRVYGILVFGAWLLGYRDRDLVALYHGKRPLGTYLVVGALAWLVLPIVISEVGRRWRYSKRLRPAVLRFMRISTGHSTPSAWDHFFGSDRLALIRVTLDDGRVVGGYFGNQSLAAYSEDTQDLFLEERWELDEDAWFVGPAASSLGLWIAHERMVSLEVYAPPPDKPRPVPGERLLATAITAAAVVDALRPQSQDATASSEPDADV
jgi:hypothetical protein